MKIEIRSMTELNDNRIVHFLSEHGEGQGIWQGIPPKVDQVYDVELEITDVLSWGDNIHACSASQYSMQIMQSIQVISSSCCFTGKLEASHHDPSKDDETYVITVRIGSSILLLETIGIPPEVGCCVTFTANNILLYDTKI